MLIKVLAVLAVVVVLLAIFISTRPATFRVERTALMSAPPAAVFAEVNDLHHWQAWSPWIELDPAAKSSFAGPSSGVGAMMSWDGNRNMGVGNMTIIESQPSKLIRFKLEFLRPFAATNTAEFTFTPQGGQTAVTWSMYGPNTFASKAISLVMDCDKMVGDQFNKGLAKLKAIVEKR